MDIDYNKMSRDDLATECAKLQSEIASEEVLLKSLRSLLFNKMKENGDDEVVTFFGRYYKAKLPVKKTYPEYIADMELSLDEAKAKAEANGEVTLGEQKYTYKFGKVKV